MISLRPYQLAAIESVRACLRAGQRSVLLAIPTGGGKTLTAASILASAVERGSRVLFVAHRLELIDQTVRTFASLGITRLGVIRAQDPRRNLAAPIQIASIQTLARRPPLEHVDVVVIDEAHRTMAKSYRKHLLETYPSAVVLGLTATPCRADGRPLGDVFKAIVLGARYSELIAGGFIVAPVVYGTPVLLDLAHVRTTAGDFNAEDLEAAVNNSALIGNTVAEWQRRADGRRTVVFAAGVAHSQALCAAFSAAGAHSEHLDGTTPEPERAAILARLERGETNVVCNVGVLCEGWDQPACKCAILARPTKSLTLYMQMAGRVLRPWHGVEPIILDHGGNVDRMAKKLHDSGLPHQDRAWSLDGNTTGTGVAPAKACPACFVYVPAGSRVCPLCGYEWPAPAPPEAVARADDAIPVELALRTLAGPDAQLQFFRSIALRASERGWKPGAVYMRFRERWGFPPPAGWMPAVKAGFRRDAEWQSRLAIRQRPHQEPT